MYKLTVESSFSSAHQLINYPGPCQRIHGHNWKVFASIKSVVLNELGMVIDLYDLKKILDECLNLFDHRLLNEVEPFNKLNPSSENLARFIYEFVEARLPQQIQMDQIQIYETDHFSVTFQK